MNFYEDVLGMRPQWSREQYAEFRTGVGVLAIFSADAQEKYIPGSADAASNWSAILQFKVADVDHEYVRLQPLVTIWVRKPTTQPWSANVCQSDFQLYALICTLKAKTPTAILPGRISYEESLRGKRNGSLSQTMLAKLFVLPQVGPSNVSQNLPKMVRVS